MIRTYMTSEKGFSLVELLITVVIAGVLAAVGVPQYKKMVGKSRTAEAKVILGAISTGESTFFTEYGSYGNDLAHMGVEMTGAVMYSGGWASAATCAPVANANYIPAAFTGEIPNYGDTANGALSSVGKFNSAQPGGTVCNALIAGTANGSVAPSNTAYTAAVSGTLDPSSLAVCPTGGTKSCDVWTITNLGVVTNTINGVANNY